MAPTLPLVSNKFKKFDVKSDNLLSPEEIDLMPTSDAATLFREVVNSSTGKKAPSSYKEAAVVLSQLAPKNQASILVENTILGHTSPEYFYRVATISPKSGALILKEIHSKYSNWTTAEYCKIFMEKLPTTVREKVFSALETLDPSFKENVVPLLLAVAPEQAFLDLISRSEITFIGETMGSMMSPSLFLCYKKLMIKVLGI